MIAGVLLTKDSRLPRVAFIWNKGLQIIISKQERNKNQPQHH